LEILITIEDKEKFNSVTVTVITIICRRNSKYVRTSDGFRAEDESGESRYYYVTIKPANDNHNYQQQRRLIS
jgi:hypothetical protein